MVPMADCITRDTWSTDGSFTKGMRNALKLDVTTAQASNTQLTEHISDMRLRVKMFKNFVMVLQVQKV